MSKATNQKLKILYIMKMLAEETDENHVLSTAEIISKLKAQGIEAERKSIYDDIENLRLFGLDIVCRRAEPRGYCLVSREFELPELRLLVDAVQSSKFITEKKTRSLIAKIEKLTGCYEAVDLHHQVTVSGRVKTTNESIYYNVDKIHSAVAENVRIRFQYCEGTMERELKPKHNGALYEVSPWVMTWDDENYYLVALEHESGEMRHYRVDKMMNISVTRLPREGMDQFAEFDIAVFSKRIFGMFAGEEKELTILFSNNLIGVVTDRFGTDVRIQKFGADSFTVTVKINISAQFYGWLAALGSGAKILAPREEADKFVRHIRKIYQRYEGAYPRYDL